MEACIPSQQKEREIYAKDVRGNVTLGTIKMASGAGTTLKEEPVALVPDLRRFVFDGIEKREK